MFYEFYDNILKYVDEEDVISYRNKDLICIKFRNIFINYSLIKNLKCVFKKIIINSEFKGNIIYEEVSHLSYEYLNTNLFKYIHLFSNLKFFKDNYPRDVDIGILPETLQTIELFSCYKTNDFYKFINLKRLHIKTTKRNDRILNISHTIRDLNYLNAYQELDLSLYSSFTFLNCHVSKFPKNVDNLYLYSKPDNNLKNVENLFLQTNFNDYSFLLNFQNLKQFKTEIMTDFNILDSLPDNLEKITLTFNIFENLDFIKFKKLKLIHINNEEDMYIFNLPKTIKYINLDCHGLYLDLSEFDYIEKIALHFASYSLLKFPKFTKTIICESYYNFENVNVEELQNTNSYKYPLSLKKLSCVYPPSLKFLNLDYLSVMNFNSKFAIKNIKILEIKFSKNYGISQKFLTLEKIIITFNTNFTIDKSDLNEIKVNCDNNQVIIKNLELIQLPQFNILVSKDCKIIIKSLENNKLKMIN